jgi:hypothetical protein
MDRRSLLIGLLAGGWLATLVGVTDLSPFKSARAQDAGAPPAGPPPIVVPLPNPFSPTTPGRTVNPATGAGRERGIPNPGGGTSAFNNRAIALAGSIGSGESVVYYFDTELQRLLVYQFQPGSRGGVRLVAARHIDYDLRLEGYRDLSDRSRDDLKADYEKQFGAAAARPAGGGPPELPTRKVDIDLGDGK